MAIYSLHHSSIGRTTHAAGTAGAHVTYITRTSACREVAGEHMPQDAAGATAWLDGQELGDRKNARVVDKVMVALPLELGREAQLRLVRRFVHEVAGGDNVPWLAAFHDKGKDAKNPHAHIVIRDRHRETGKRVAELSGKGSTERLRVIWEKCANEALKEVGLDAKIDRRSLKEQGIERKAQIHKGAKVKAIEEKGIKPVSHVRTERNIRGQEREVRYPEIDQGRTRTEFNDNIISFNQYQALPNDVNQLERIFDGKTQSREAAIIKRAKNLAVRIGEKLNDQEQRVLAHNEHEPKAPEFLAMFREGAYKKRFAVWNETAEKLKKRYTSLKKRLEKAKEYTRDSLWHQSSKAKGLAIRQVRNVFPELAMKLDTYREEREKKRREQLAQAVEQRKKQQELELTQKFKQREANAVPDKDVVTLTRAPRSR